MTSKTSNFWVIFWAFAIVVAVTLAMNACVPKGGPLPTPTPAPTQEPTPSKIGILTACVDKVRLCANGKPLYLRGYSDYGAFSNYYDYDDFMALLQDSGINLMREWTAPYPRYWNASGPQPFIFDDNTKVIVNEDFFRNVDEFVTAAARRNIYVLVDLVDRYGVGNQKDFADNPMNWKLGGPLKQGLPDLYISHVVIDMITKTVQRLEKHDNIIYQVCNEPIGGTDAQIIAFHKKAIQVIKAVKPSALVCINPVPDKRDRPLVPLAGDVGADFVTIHGAGVENPRDSASLTPEAIRKRLEAIRNWHKVPVLSDDDAFHKRDELPLLRNLVLGAVSSAGFNHRGNEPVNGEAPDLKAIEIITQEK